VTLDEARGPTADGPAPIPAPTGGLAQQTAIYGLSGVALPVVGLITLPIFARALSQAEFGILALATVASFLALAVADSGFASAALRSYYDYTDADEAERQKVVFTAFSSTTAIALLIAVVGVLANEPISELLFGRKGLGSIVIVIALSVPLITVANFLREAMRFRFRARDYLVSSLVGAVLAGAVGIVAVLAFDLGPKGVLIGLLVGNGAAAAYGLLVLRYDLGHDFSRYELRKMLAFGLPLVPTAISLWALALVDRIMLEKLGNLSDVGQYEVANRVAGVLLFGVNAFMLALGPYLYSIFSEDRTLEKVTRGRILTYFTFTLSLAALALTLFAREVISLVAPDFPDSYKAVGLLSLGMLAFGVGSIAMAGISLARRTVYFALFTGAAGIFNIALNFALIPPYGMVGAAFATAAAYALLAALYYWMAQRVYPTPYEPWKVLALLGLAVLCSVPGFVRIEPHALEIAVKLLALVVFVVGARMSGAIGGGELGELRRFVRGMVPFGAARA
jgi:O-antigen/teichoic acid export membrane protein